MSHLGRTPLQRFWEKVDQTETCWLWTASKNADGYGRFYLDRERIGAHRAAYMLLVGAIPDGLTVDHLCRITSCVNPDHLELVTSGENVRRANLHRPPAPLLSICRKGHDLTPENTIMRSDGRLRCAVCKRRADHASHVRRGVVNCRCAERAEELLANLGLAS